MLSAIVLCVILACYGQFSMFIVLKCNQFAPYCNIHVQFSMPRFIEIVYLCGQNNKT